MKIYCKEMLDFDCFFNQVDYQMNLLGQIGQFLLGIKNLHSPLSVIFYQSLICGSERSERIESANKAMRQYGSRLLWPCRLLEWILSLSPISTEFGVGSMCLCHFLHSRSRRLESNGQEWSAIGSWWDAMGLNPIVPLLLKLRYCPFA